MRNLTDKEKFCLDAYISNGNLDMAYLLSRDKPTTSSKPDIVRRMALRWFRDRAVQKYVNEQRGIILSGTTNHSEDEGTLGDYRNKDFLLNEFVKQLKVTTEPKLRADLLWRISELQNMRKKEEESKAKTTHIYLPLSCLSCSLYQAHKRESEESSHV